MAQEMERGAPSSKHGWAGLAPIHGFRPAVSDAIEIDLQPPAMDQLDRFEIPTLVLIGEHEVAEFRLIAKLTAGRIRGESNAIISETAHLPRPEEPEQFNRIVFRLLR